MRANLSNMLTFNLINASLHKLYMFSDKCMDKEE